MTIYKNFEKLIKMDEGQKILTDVDVAVVNDFMS